MKDIILLKSRGGIKNYLKKLSKPDGVDSKTFILKLEVPFMRMLELPGNKKAIDPKGGPIIAEGEYLEEADAVVESINHAMGKGYIITFRE